MPRRGRNLLLCLSLILIVFIGLMKWVSAAYASRNLTFAVKSKNTSARNKQSENSVRDAQLLGQSINSPLTLTVNDTGDAADANVGDGICDTDLSTPGNQCTLRAAIQETEAVPGGDTINFALPANSTITLNTALPVILDNLTISGPGAKSLTVKRNAAAGTPQFRIFAIGRNGSILGDSIITVRISGMTITGGHAPDSSSGLDMSGGGIGIYRGPTVYLTGMAISGNQTGEGLGKASDGVGGGIYNQGTLTVINSTVSNNSTGTTGINAFSDWGGGIYNDGGTMVLINSTVSSNHAGTGHSTSASGGAGIANRGTLNINNSTVSANVNLLGDPANSIVRGAGVYNEGTVTSKNSIFADNLGGGDFMGTFNSQDYNLIEETNNVSFTGITTHNITGKDALLAPLADNGGPTPTQMPLPASPAINVGDTANLPADTYDLDSDGDTTEALPLDQRNKPRVVGTKFDIGAVETDYSISATDGTSQSAAVNTAFGSKLKAAVTESGLSVSGIPVTFTAPATVASGTFPGNATTANVITDGSGVATAPIFTANGKMGGPYGVVASLGATLPTATYSLTNLKGQAQVILSNLSQSYDGAPKIPVVTTNPAGLAVALTYDGSATPPTGVGTYQVVATVTDPNYNGQAAGTLTINKGNQTITFGALQGKTFGDAPFTVSAIASSGLAVSFSIVSGPATISGNTITITGTGTVVVRASQSGNSNYNVATDVDRSFVVAKANPVITWNNPADITYGTALSSTQLNATSIVQGTFTYSPAVGTVLSAGNNQTLTVNFTPTDAANYNSASKSVSINVLKANQTITFDALPNKTYGDPAFTVSASASSGLSVSFSISSGPATINGNTITITGAGTVVVHSTQPGNANYNAAPAVDQSFIVNKAQATITLGSLSQTYTGGVKFVSATTNPSGLSVTITYSQNSSPVSFPINVGAYNVTATINNSNYQGSASDVLVINKATPTIFWNNPANIVVGTPLSGLQLNATASVPGTFSYNPTAGTLLPLGIAQLLVTFTPTDTSNYNGATKSVQLTVTPPPPPALTFSSASYQVSEAAGNVAVIVNRTGDTAPAVSVNYATSDSAGLQACNTFNGFASSRCDYANTLGTLRFASGETAKTIFIPIVNDSYAEGTETFSITLSSPSQGASLGPISTARVSIVDDDAVTSTPNPITDTKFFIRQQYIDFLGREPDPIGWQGWQDILNNCQPTDKSCDRIAVSSGFFRSPEFQDRGYFIYRFYPVALGRAPHYSEFMPDMAKVSGFLTAEEQEANKVAFITEFMSRPEFTNRYGPAADPAVFVDGLLQTCGIPNHPSRDTWVAQLTSGAMTRAQVLRALAESSEVYQKFYNEAFVVMQYFGYLRRDPDILYLEWIKTMNTNGGDYRDMINGFMNSSEYFLRFGP